MQKKSFIHVLVVPDDIIIITIIGRFGQLVYLLLIQEV